MSTTIINKTPPGSNTLSFRAIQAKKAALVRSDRLTDENLELASRIWGAKAADFRSWFTNEGGAA